MKALIYKGARNLQFGDAAMPLGKDGEVLLRVAAVGICGSDMHAYLGHDERRPPPLILGHEVAGTTADGKWMTVNPLITCGHCSACRRGRENICVNREILSMPPREGAFAEYVSVPAKNLTAVPAGVSPEKAALVEPLACGWHAVRLAIEHLDRPLEECRCLVLGGGAIGLGAALVLAAHKAVAVCIVEQNPLRHPQLVATGDFQVCAPAAAPTEVDVVIDAVGVAATRAAACRAVRTGGVILHVGLGDGVGGVDARRLTLGEITFIGAYTYTTADFHATAIAVFNGKLGALDWFEARPLADGADAFADILNGRVAASKIILKP